MLGLVTTSEALDNIITEYTTNNETLTKSSFEAIQKTSSKGTMSEAIDDATIRKILKKFDILTKENTFGSFSLPNDLNRSRSKGTEISSRNQYSLE